MPRRPPQRPRACGACSRPRPPGRASDPTASLDAPAPLTTQHELDAFQSGEPGLDDWLCNRTMANGLLGASKTYVVCPAGSVRVVGYYALSMGHILAQDAAAAMRRNMPRQIPVLLLGRLAIDQAHQRRGLGAALLRDAVARAERAAGAIAARLVVVHAISAEAETFYQHHGFTRLPVDTPTYGLDLTKSSWIQASRASLERRPGNPIAMRLDALAPPRFSDSQAIPP